MNRWAGEVPGSYTHTSPGRRLCFQTKSWASASVTISMSCVRASISISGAVRSRSAPESGGVALNQASLICFADTLQSP